VLVKNSSISSLRGVEHLPSGKTRTFRHHCRGACDRVGQVKILDGTLEPRFLNLATPGGKLTDIIDTAWLDVVEPHQMRDGLEKRLPQAEK
jgi:hypothetical protein